MELTFFQIFQCLLESDERQRKEMMFALLHLPVDPSILIVDTRSTDFMCDPLIKLPDSVTLSRTQNDVGNTKYGGGGRMEIEVPYRALGVIFRVLFLMCASRRRGGVESGDTDYIRVGACEYEALVKQIVLLNCGTDLSALHAVTPSPHTVQVCIYVYV